MGKNGVRLLTHRNCRIINLCRPKSLSLWSFVTAAVENSNAWHYRYDSMTFSHIHWLGLLSTEATSHGQLTHEGEHQCQLSWMTWQVPFWCQNVSKLTSRLLVETHLPALADTVLRLKISHFPLSNNFNPCYINSDEKIFPLQFFHECGKGFRPGNKK